MNNCWLCMEIAFFEKMILPCKCKGPIEYVHEKCFLNWIEKKGGRNREWVILGADGKFQISCEICCHKRKQNLEPKSIYDKLLKKFCSIDIIPSAASMIMGYSFWWLTPSGWALHLLGVRSKSLSVSILSTACAYGIRGIKNHI